MSEQEQSTAGWLERSHPHLRLRIATGGYAAQHADRLAANAAHVATYAFKRLKPLRQGNGDLPRPTVVLALSGAADAPSRPRLVDGAWLLELDSQSDEAAFYVLVARALISQHFEGADLWQPPPGQANADAITNAIDFLVTGLARYFVTHSERLGVPRHTADEVSRQAAADREGKVPLYECLLRGPTYAASVPEYEALAESFCGYLFERDGPKAYCRLVTRCTDNPNNAADLVYGKNFEQLRDEWLGALLRGEHRRPISIMSFARQVLPYLRPYIWNIVVAILLMLLSVYSAQILPFTFRDIIDIVTGAAAKGDPSFFGDLWAAMNGAAPWLEFEQKHDVSLVALGRLYAKVIVLTLANFVYAASTVWLVYAVNVINNNVIRDLRMSFTRRMHGVNASFYSRSRMGDMISRFTSDVVRMAEPLSEATAYSIYWTIFLIGTINSMYWMSWQLMVVAFFIVPIYLVANRRFGPALQGAHRIRQERLAQLNAGLEEQLFAHSLVRSYGLGGHLMTGFGPRIGEFRKVAIWADFLQTVYREVLNVVDNIQQKIVLAAGGTLAVFGVVTVGTITAFNTLAVRFISTLHRFGSIYAYISIAAASLRRVEEILRLPIEKLDTPPGGAYKPEAVHEAITFENVDFSYTGAEPTLRNVNLRIPAGSHVAFVGPTGAGKSTLVNLIPRFYDVDRGAVKIDGLDIRSFSLAGLREAISIVAQDTFIFNSTIRENIRLGRLDATDAEVIEAAKGASLHDFILTLPAGYDSLVGERGSRLSGGQRQRVAIARALLRQAPIMLLDEATSALDAETEAEILTELEQVTRGKTVISITHRLGLAIQSDWICVLQAGEVVEQGTHEELIQRPGLYRKLFEDQNRELIRRGAGEAGEGYDEQPEPAVPAFTMVPSDEVDGLGDPPEVERYAAGEVFRQRTAEEGRQYVLAAGQVELIVHGENGDEQRLSVAAPSGENGRRRLSLVLSVPAGVTARAASAVELHVLNAEIPAKTVNGAEPDDLAVVSTAVLPAC